MPEGRQPRGVTPHPRSGVAAKSARLRWRRNGRRGATPRPKSGAATRRVTPHPRSGAAAGRSNPTPEARVGGREELPQVQGAVAAKVPEGLEELFHVQGPEGWR